MPFKITNMSSRVVGVQRVWNGVEEYVNVDAGNNCESQLFTEQMKRLISLDLINVVQVEGKIAEPVVEVKAEEVVVPTEIAEDTPVIENTEVTKEENASENTKDETEVNTKRRRVRKEE